MKITQCALALLVGASPSFGQTVLQPIALNRWPAVASDLTPNPNITFGTLANGLHYAIRHNANPAHAVSIRMRIEVGSVDEAPGQSGIAHVLEHMVFRGSESLSDGQAMKALQDLGAAPGIDANAVTRSSDTVFQLELPQASPDNLNRALTILREVTGKALLSEGALQDEKRVILAERRERLSPNMEMTLHSTAFVLGDAAASAVMPLGTEDTINAITADQLRSFYRSEYRPDHATIVIVGDVNAGAIAGQLAAIFGDWSPSAPVATSAAIPLAPHKAADVALYKAPGVNNLITSAWVSPYDSGPYTEASERRDSIRLVALVLLNQRFVERSQAVDAPFIQAGFLHQVLWRIANVDQITVIYAPGKRDAAELGVEQVRRGVIQNGISADQLARAIGAARAFLVQQTELGSNGTSAQGADDIVASLSSHGVPTSPELEIKLFDEATKALTASGLQEAVAQLFAGVGPIVFAASSTSEGDETDLRKIFKGILEPTSTVSGPVPGSWPYLKHSPGAVTAKDENKPLGLTVVHYENGVVLIIKPNHAIQKQVLLDVGLGDGRIGAPADGGADWSFVPGFLAGGMGKVSLLDLAHFIAGKTIQIKPDIDDRAFHLVVTTTGQDLQNAFDILAAYQSDPGFRSEGLARAKSTYEQARTSINGAALATAIMGIPCDLRSGDRRWAPATSDQVQGLTAVDWKAALMLRLQSRPADIVVSGDVDPDAVIAAVGSSFGTLPRFTGVVATVGNEKPSPPQVMDPIASPQKTGQVVPAIAWPTPGFGRDAHVARVLAILAAAFQQKLFDDLRTKQGLSYSPDVFWQGSHATPDFGDLVALAQVPVNKTNAFYESATRIADELAAAPLSDSDLSRIKGPLLADIRKGQVKNEYWLIHLRDAGRDPQIIALAENIETDYQSVTAEEVQIAAKTYLRADKIWKKIYSVPK